VFGRHNAQVGFYHKKEGRPVLTLVQCWQLAACCMTHLDVFTVQLPGQQLHTLICRVAQNVAQVRTWILCNPIEFG
jgi:hypothetical protein